jgi:hypothetical protein
MPITNPTPVPVPPPGPAPKPSATSPTPVPVTASVASTVFTQTVGSEFLLTNNNSSIDWAAPAQFTSYGTGTPMTTGGGIGPVAVCWKTGSLANAPAGAVVAVLDINFFGSGAFPQYYDPDFIDNLSLTLNNL